MRVVSLLPSSTEILFAIGAGDQRRGRHPRVRFIRQCAHDAACADLVAAAGRTATRRRSIATCAPACTPARRCTRSTRSAWRARARLDRHARTVRGLRRLLRDRRARREASARRPARHLARTVVARGRLRDDRVLGELDRLRSAARRRCSRLRAREAALRDTLARCAGHVPPRALILEWTDPPMSGGHWTPGLVELAGGIPMLANPGANSQTLDWEAIAPPIPTSSSSCRAASICPNAQAAAIASCRRAEPCVAGLRAVRKRPRVTRWTATRTSTGPARDWSTAPKSSRPRFAATNPAKQTRSSGSSGPPLGRSKRIGEHAPA
jgi:iron complex transport system substrate-binding protein